jgi:serine/threonine protein kinase/tetratricopeptide (TPR) repeat protein
MAFSLPLSEPPGERIGHYKLLQRIGEGALGLVYLAEQEEPVRRRVAIKIMKPGMDVGEVAGRFEAERQALALLDHPNIAKVLDAGVTPDGRAYFVTELVQGERITEYCDKNNLTIRQRVDLFVQVCHGVQHAHQKGILHRNLKPSNILVTVQDGAPVPKVIEFGIAKATNQRLEEKSFFTALGEFVGTPIYLSPELAEMSGPDIDTRSDIYSLGVLLYELVTGKTPFDPKELQGKGIEAMRQTTRFDPKELLTKGIEAMGRAIREEEPRCPSTRLTTMDNGELTMTAKRRQTDARKLVHLVSGDLDRIVMKCLEKDRTRRCQTADGLASDLLRQVINEPVLAPRASTAYWILEAWQRKKTVFAAAVLSFMVLVGVTCTSYWQAHLARKRLAQSKANETAATQRLAESQANETLAKKILAESQTNETLAKQSLVESEAISQFLTGLFQSPDLERDGRTISFVDVLGAATKKLETELTNEPAARAKLQATLGATYQTLGLYREAISLKEKVRDYYLAASGLEHPDTLMAMVNLANSYFQAGRREDALKLRQEALALFRKVSGPEHPATLMAMNNLAISYDDAGRPSEALLLREQVLPFYRKLIGPEHPATLMAMNNLANSYFQAGRREEALKLREKQLPLYRKVLGPEHPDTLMAMNNLANSYFQAGRHEEALKLREDALALFHKVSGPENPDTLHAMNNLAISYDDAGRQHEALALREQVLALFLKINGLEHPDTIGTMEELADAYDRGGRRDEALKLKEQVLLLRRKVLGPEHPDTLATMNRLAWTLATSDASEIRNGTNAVNFAEEAVKATRRANAGFLDTLAAAYAETQQFDKATAVEQEAIGLLHSEKEKKDFDSRLKLYQSNKPCRQGANP